LANCTYYYQSASDITITAAGDRSAVTAASAAAASSAIAVSPIQPVINGAITRLSASFRVMTCSDDDGPPMSVPAECRCRLSDVGPRRS